jgi:phosphoribosylaminoimidazolecarboxamide formyltransferase / IMP cyclohydrolase
MPRALLSVSDKEGLIDFAQGLSSLEWTLVASGGTAATLESAGMKVTEVSQITGAPEMLGGRVKTLHPSVHAGILARDNQVDVEEIAAFDIEPIDMVVCNLYPFQKTVSKAGVQIEDAVENIDIGGVTLLRAAAKNFTRVTVICDPSDYRPVLTELTIGEQISSQTRQTLAVKAFAHTRDYDTAIEAYLRQQLLPVNEGQASVPSALHLSLPLAQSMRYGENPHQVAGLYAEPGAGPLGGALLQGKPLSYNNVLDLDAAWRAALDFKTPTLVIVKHLCPCGIASHHDLPEAFRLALASDPVSAFGGVIAVNRSVTESLAHAMNDLFVEAIIAPHFEPAAISYFAQHKPNCRLVAVPTPVESKWELRSVAGGMLLQSVDGGDPEPTAWRVVSQRQPTEQEMAAITMGWQACQHVKSNAIVLAVAEATVGIGGGLPSRVDAVKLAVFKAGERAQGAILASDAFFPFPDGVETAAVAGVTAIVQPGGSVRDDEVIAAADRLGLTMIFTGTRHFRH